MMIVVEIRSDEIRSKSGVSARTNKQYSIREQDGFIHLPGQPYPQKCKLALDDGAAPYQPGIYELDPESYFVGRFDQVMIRLRLDRASREMLSGDALRAVSA